MPEPDTNIIYFIWFRLAGLKCIFMLLVCREAGGEEEIRREMEGENRSGTHSLSHFSSGQVQTWPCREGTHTQTHATLAHISRHWHALIKQIDTHANMHFPQETQNHSHTHTQANYSFIQGGVTQIAEILLHWSSPRSTEHIWMSYWVCKWTVQSPFQQTVDSVVQRRMHYITQPSSAC